VGRLVAVGLQAIFLLAICQFGLLDAIGHWMIIAIFVVLFLRGLTRAREILVLREKLFGWETYFMTGLYFLAFDMIFIAYYGRMHHRNRRWQGDDGGGRPSNHTGRTHRRRILYKNETHFTKTFQ
jgi:hypothetical protein